VTDLSVFFAGTAGSVPTARRGLPAIVVRHGGHRLLFDCGEGTQRQLLRSIGLTDLDAVFLTHHHVDHWLGLLGMVKSFALRDREAPLTVYGPPGTRELLAAMGIVIGRLPYPFSVVDLEAGDEVEFADFAVHALNVRHRGRAFGYALVEEDRPGRFDAERARELGIPFGPAFGRLQRGETVDGVSPEQVVGPPRAGRRVVLSGDTAPCEMLRVAADGADLLVHEATFLSEDAARARDTLHSTARQAAELAAEADVGLLALTHLSSRYPVREVLAEARETFAHTEAPRDFDAIEVPLPEKGDPELVRWDPPARSPAEAAP
jgi:ribonuclease Z